MAKIKTVRPDGKVISVEGSLRLLASSDKWTQRVEVWLLNSKVNRNNWQYLNLDKHKALFANTPLLCAYVGSRIGDGHNMRMIRDGAGNEIPDFRDATAERIVGVFPSIEDIEIREKNGVEWIVGIGTIYTWYAYQLVEKLKRQGSLSISIETLIDEMHYDGDVEVFTKYQILGTTILNEDVPPAVADANIRALSALGVNSVREITNLRVASANAEIRKDTSNPQKKTKKEQKKMGERFSIDALAPKFEGYRVLSVKGDSVCLFADGKAFGYTFAADSEDVNANDIKPVVLNASAAVGDETLDISAEALYATLAEQYKSASEALTGKVAEIAALTAKIDAMTKAENERRVAAVKEAVKRTLAEFNANREDGEKVAESACDEIIASAEKGEYNEICDADGKWIGDIKAADAVAAICGRKQMEIDKANAAKRANLAAKHWAFEPNNGEGAKKATENDIASLIADLQ